MNKKIAMLLLTFLVVLEITIPLIPPADNPEAGVPQIVCDDPPEYDFM